MGESLLIRADADPLRGTGHFMRMLALAEAWVESGGSAYFAGRVPSELARRAQSIGAEVHAPPTTFDDAEWTVERARNAGVGLVVADGYHFPIRFQRAVRAAGLRLAIVDDNAENAPYDTDWILNVNVHASEGMYAERNADCRCLLGTSYALIRSAIRRARPPAQRADRAERILVSMGGADPPNATGHILTALARETRQFRTTVLVGAANPRLEEYRRIAAPETTLLFNVEDVTSVMLAADVALAAVGGTIWELGLLGVPCVALSLADNQVKLAEELQRRGAIDYAGDARAKTDAEQWLERAFSLLKDPARRRALVSSSRAFVDGEGARRVVQRFKEE